jgi:hypothetical protein
MKHKTRELQAKRFFAPLSTPIKTLVAGHRNLWAQKRDSAESQPFVNLKSNTMKNTLQS